MSVRKITEGVNQWNKDMPFPKDMYSCHCVEESLEISQDAKNPMIKRVWEIVFPETVKVGDRTVSVAGCQVTQYRVTKVHNDEGDGWDNEKSDKAFGALQEELIKLGYDQEEIDDENPPLIAKGKTCDFVVYGKLNKKFKSPTPEQAAKGQKIGDPIKGPDGKEIITYQLQFDGTLLGMSAKQISSAF